jgi:hypothetical protein
MEVVALTAPSVGTMAVPQDASIKVVRRAEAATTHTRAAGGVE